MKISYSKNLAWLDPYTRDVEDLVPLKRLVSVKGYPLRYRAQDFTEGLTTIDEKKHARITLATHLNIAGKRIARNLVNLLQVYAHELAHLIEWNHSPEHWQLESEIAHKFATRAKREGIKDVSRRLRF